MNEDNIQYFIFSNRTEKLEVLVRIINGILIQYFDIDGLWKKATMDNFSKHDTWLEINFPQAKRFMESKYQYYLRKRSGIFVRVINGLTMEYLDKNGEWQETPNGEWLFDLETGDDSEFQSVTINQINHYLNDIENSKKMTR